MSYDPLLLGYYFCFAGSLGAERPGWEARLGSRAPRLLPFVPYFICSWKRGEIGHGGNYRTVIVPPQSIKLSASLAANCGTFPTPAYLRGLENKNKP